MNDWKKQLKRGSEALGLTLTDEQQQQLLDYLLLLEKWNRAYNLTAIRDPQKMVAMQLLDSLATMPFIPDGDLADVGSGGGAPGIPLAIAQPQRQVTLLDSNGKKTRFLNQARMQLGLGNVAVVQSRLESWRPPVPPRTIISRAFTDLPQMLDWLRHLLTPESTLLAMKGQYPHDEIAAIAGEGVDVEVIPLTVPGVEGERHLVCVTGFQVSGVHPVGSSLK